MNQRETFFSYTYITNHGIVGQGSCHYGKEPTCWDDILELQEAFIKDNHKNNSFDNQFRHLVITNFRAFPQQE